MTRGHPLSAGVISGDRAMPLRHRVLFNNPKVLCFDAKFSSEMFICFDWKCRVRKCESAPCPQTPWGYMVKRISAYGGCLGGRRR
jgi:hypothetical protein